MELYDSAGTAKSLDFHIKEFEHLRTEIMFFIGDLRFTERAAVIGPMFAYSWLAVQGRDGGDSALLVVAWWLPFILAVFLQRRRQYALQCIWRVAGYMRRLEEQIALPALGGWQHHMDEFRTGQGRPFWHADRIFWVCLLSLYFSVALIATYEKLSLGALAGALGRQWR